jgi:predicted transposase/invertase (TIGR01784 family)
MALEKIPYHGEELFCPKYDRVFKALLLGGEDYTLLSSFLTSVLGTEIRKENVISASSMELPTMHGDDKIIRLDFLIRLADGVAVNIELQVGKDFSMGERSLHQLSRITANSVDKGEVAADICPVIAINVLDYDYICGGDGYHNRYRMKNVVTGAEMPGAEIFEIQFIDLPKFPKNAGNSMKELWMKFLTAKTEEELEMLTKESPIMATAVDRLVYASGTPELRKQMDDYERNELKNLLTRRYDRKEGRMEGELKAKLEIARNLLNEGIKDAEAVARITGLEIDDVLRLQQ